MHDDARGLVDDDQVLVLEGDLEPRDRRVDGRRVRRAILLEHLDPLAAAHARPLARRRAVDEHETGGEQARGLRARAERPGEERVEALALGLRRDVELHRHLGILAP